MAAYTKTLDNLLSELENKEENSLIPKILRIFQTELVHKDEEITKLKEDVSYLSKKINEQERYNSKNCLIITNLPLVSGDSYFKDVVTFLRDYLGIMINETDLQACHPLGSLTNRNKPPNVIVRFLHFFTKDRVWARKYQLKGKINPLNGSPIYLRERLTKVDSELMDYARGLGCVTTSLNSAPQIMVKFNGGKKAHTIVDYKDVDELYAHGKAITKRVYNRQPDLNNVTVPVSVQPKQTSTVIEFGHAQNDNVEVVQEGRKGVKRGMESSPNRSFQELMQKLKNAKEDPQKLQELAEQLSNDDQFDNV